MSQTVVMTGMVLNAMPIGDYDKRITILTKERGKITAFARGARRPNSQLLAVTNPFVFGEFELFEGKSAYNLARADVSNYFRELANDLETAYYGFYFLELADYYAQENSNEREMLKLLYQSLRALESASIPNRLVRRIYELKVLVFNGEYPNVFSCMKCGKKEALTWFDVKYGGILCADCGKLTFSILLDESTRYTLQYVISSSIKELYRFTVSEQVLICFEKIMTEYMNVYTNHEFRTLRVLEDSGF